MVSTENELRFRLSYDLVLCLGCGVKRVRGVVCADCAARPAVWEVDHRVTARRAAVHAAFELLDAAPEQSPPAPFRLKEMEGLMKRLERWLPHFFSAIRSVSTTRPGAEEALLLVVRDLVAEQAAISTAARCRPWTPLVDGSQQCIAHLLEMVRSYLRAVSAPTPLQAQNYAEAAQQHMDAAGAVLSPHMQGVTRLTDLVDAGSIHNQLVVLLQQAMRDFEASDLTELGARAEAALGAAVGVAPGQGCGVGFQFALQRAAVAVYGDVERFDRVVKASAALVARRPELVSDMAVSQHFAADTEAASLDLFDASVQAAQAMDGEIPRQIGRSLVDIAVSLVEGPGQLAAIALLTGSGQKTKPYEKLRQDNATELLRSARKRSDMEPLLEGFDLDLRTAQAHRMVRYSDDGVTVDVKSGSRTLTWDELADTIFMSCESAMGCLVGLTHALSRLGISLGRADGYQAIGISPQAMLHAALMVMGCSDIALEETQDTWTVIFTAPADTPLTSLAASLTSLVPQGVTTMTLLADRAGERHVLSGAVSLLRHFTDTTDPDGDQYGIAAVRLQRLWTHNGQPCIDKATARCWAARQVSTAISADAHSIPRLRALRALALETGDPELAEVLTAVMRSTRLGDNADRRTKTLVAQLDIWGSTPVPYQPV